MDHILLGLLDQRFLIRFLHYGTYDDAWRVLFGMVQIYPSTTEKRWVFGISRKSLDP